MPVCFVEQRGRGGEEVKLEDHLSCKIGRDVLIFSFLQPFTAGEGQMSPTELKKKKPL